MCRRLYGRKCNCHFLTILSILRILKLVEDERDIVIASDEDWQYYWELRCEDPLSDAESFKKGENGKVQSLGKKAKNIEEIEEISLLV